MEEIINNINKEQISSYSKLLSRLSPLELVTIGYIISLILVETLTPYEQNTIGNFLEMVGQVLLTSFAQSSAIDPNINSPSHCEFNNLKIDVENIKQILTKFSQSQY